jgi:hypothetical protein
MIAVGVIEDAGSYRQNYRSGLAFAGWRVKLYRTARAERRTARAAVPGYLTASTGRRARVKQLPRRLAWFETVLGSPDGRPPPGLPERAARRMVTLDDLRAPGSAAA